MNLRKWLFKHKISFRVYLLELFLFLFVIYAAAMMTVIYFTTSQIINNTAVDHAQESTHRIQQQVRDYIGEAAQATRIIGSYLQANEEYRISPQRHEFLWDLLWPVMQQLPALNSLYIADEEGNFLQVRQYPRLATRIIDRSSISATEQWIYRNDDYEPLENTWVTPQFDHRKRDWYRDIGTQPQNYWSKPYVFNSDGKQGITISFPVLDADGDKSLVVATDITLEQISIFLEHKPITENAGSGVFNTAGRLIAGPAFLKNGKEPEEVIWLGQTHPRIYAQFQRYLQKPEPVYHMRNEDDTKDWLMTFQPVTILDWYVGTAIPLDDLTEKAMELIYKMLVASLATFIMMIILIYFMVTRVSRPLIKISEETKRLKQFDLESIKPVSSNITEIDLVNRSLMSSVDALKAFRRYLPAELVRQLVEQGKGGELGGEKYELTIFFSDIANFTSTTERLDAQQLMLQLSEYFDEVTKLIMGQNGTVDKYIGDGVMAFWGAPTEVDRSAEKACHAALAIQKRIKELNLQWVAEGRPRFDTRIGLHTGEAIVGNVGSSECMNYSAIGDGVNLASRLEGLNKEFGTQIIISKATWLQVHERFQCRPLGDVRVKGKNQPVTVFELVSEI